MELTAEQINQNYSALLDSVAVIKNGKPEFMTDADWVGMVDRNKEHLSIMLEKPYWTDAHDLSPIRAVLV